MGSLPTPLKPHQKGAVGPQATVPLPQPVGLPSALMSCNCSSCTDCRTAPPSGGQHRGMLCIHHTHLQLAVEPCRCGKHASSTNTARHTQPKPVEWLYNINKYNFVFICIHFSYLFLNRSSCQENRFTLSKNTLH